MSDAEPEFEVTVIDMKTEGHLMPPAADVCQQCAVDHEPDEPHDQQSLFYQFWFYRQRGQWPSWADAMAHCSPEVQEFWVEQLTSRGVFMGAGLSSQP